MSNSTAPLIVNNLSEYAAPAFASPVTVGHISSTGTAPTIAAGTGAGTSLAIAISGTDTNGVVSVTTGTLPTLAAVIATITFNAVFGSAPKTIMLTPANANAAALSGVTMVFVDPTAITTALWTITAGATALTAATAYKWQYQVMG